MAVNWQLFVLAALIALSALLSAAETSFGRINRIRLRQMSAGGNWRARLVEELRAKKRSLVAIRVGDNLANMAAAALFTWLLRNRIAPGQTAIAAGIALVLLVLIFGEIWPLTIATNNPERIAYRLARPISWVVRLLAPLVWLLTLVSDWLAKLWGTPVGPQADVTEEEIRSLVHAGEQQGVIEDTESRMIQSVLELTDTPVRSVMVPRTAITAIDVNISHEQLLHVVRQQNYSRLPVFDGDIDNIIGLLHLKDICALTDDERQSFNLKQHLRPTIYVVETKHSGLVLRELQKHRVYMAIIIDEYGGTAGLVTVEDLIEEIVGEIVDEYDVEDPPIELLDQFTACFDARLKVEEVNQEMQTKLPLDRAKTIGGLVYDLLNHIPKEGESTTAGRVILTVDRMDRRSIERVKVTVKQ